MHMDAQPWTRESLSSLYLSPALAVLSLVYVSLKWLLASHRLPTDFEGDSDYPAKHRDVEKNVKALDGLAITAFRIIRLLVILVLLSLEIYTLSIDRGLNARFYQPPFYIYVLLLAIASIVASPRWRDVSSRQLAFLLFAEFTVYFVLDAWPYATMTPIPFDPASDPVTWTRLALLTLGGLVIPLVMPRPFRALTPDAQPCLEDTSSLLSRYTYSFLDDIVFHAFRVPDITVADMPHMPERETIGMLGQKALAAFDPVKVGKRNIFWGMMRLWKREYALLLFWLALTSAVEFTSPYGVKNLLEYLETGVSPHNVQAWIWIVVLTFGPLTAAFMETQYFYFSSRITVEVTSVLPYLVFHHALRIRLKSDVLDEKKEGKGMGDPKSTDASTRTSTTPAAIDVESDATSGDDQAPGSTDSNATKTSTNVGDAEPAAEGGHGGEKADHLVGRINNLITTDLSAIAGFSQVVAFPTAITQLVISVIFLYNLLGWRKVVYGLFVVVYHAYFQIALFSSLVGFAAMLLLSPALAYIGKLIANVQQSKMFITDKRVQSVTESMGVLRMIKLFAWEPFILKRLAQKREEELSKMRHFRLLDESMDLMNQMLPLFSKLIVLSIYTLVSRGELLASRIFSAFMIFNMMEEQVFRVMNTIPELLKAKVSFDRYSEFLNSTELLDASDDSLVPGVIDQALMTEQPDKDVIGFNACSFSWDSFADEGSQLLRRPNTRKQFKLRFNDEVTFKRGHINLIVGPTASGKTSVLMALLGEMYCKPHGLGSWYSLPRDAGIAYAPQETWVLNETIRENILLGEVYDEERYKKVLHQCALERDLDLWEAGDLTEARVTLARALYSRASILLLDDVLAALDVHTAKWIVDKAFNGDLVQGRTILLVTHNIALTAPVAGHVIDLGGNGSVAAQGSVSDVLKNDSQLRAQVEKEREEINENVEEKLDESEKPEGGNNAETDNAKKDAGKLVVAEEKAMGRVEMAAIMLYVRGVGGPLVWTLLLGTRWFAVLVMILQTWFVAYWSNQYEKYPASEIPTLKYLGIFIFVNLTSLIANFISQVIWVFSSMRASRVIHLNLLESIFASPFRWLDVTPVGRIITRCTQDMGTIDENIPHFASPFISVTIHLTCLFFSAVLMVGWYALIPGVMVAGLGGLLGRIYLKCQICVRREMSNAKSPVMSQVGTALTGLPSIRAYGAQNLFRSVLEERIDVYTRASYTFYDINRWVSIRVDTLGAVFAGVVSAYLVYGGRIGAGFAGFTLSMVLSFTRNILYWVRIYNLLEIQANRFVIFKDGGLDTYVLSSLERMLEFMRIDHEPRPSESGKPPAYWPLSGELRVENLCARYSDDSPEVLRDVSFEVKSGERVGIVGRTGAGKSSIALALLRAIKTTGKVHYDGFATDEINLDALRSNITLIPQQPELIHGTLRENLDPFEHYDDALLNDALRAAGFFNMKEVDADPPENDQPKQSTSEGVPSSTGPEESAADTQTNANAKIGLDTMVESGGTNFSLGQRQIIALARAIVRRSKLLILDEATAAIDYSTDSAIQKTLRTEFDRDMTLITIAHRLQTIMDYDKIMVLDAGQVVEFDSPKKLLEKEKGFLRALVDESDDREILHKLAGFQR
ncbi:hypothetical protein M0805_008723 [Coniferiporia weirii]|nr:hypothetical protein M0805_008723 [Coniferiporia weirii]